MLRTALLVAIVAGMLAILRTLSGDEPVCPHHSSACYFSEGYSASRARFRAAATGANATLHTLKLPTGRDLTIDVAVLDAGISSVAMVPTLVHMSGTHGLEAYAGSAVQLALLEKFTREPSSRRGVRVVLVHAVNPFGFYCGRRFNEDNIDLNRNLLEPAEFSALREETPRVSLYDSMEWMFNMRSAWTPLLDDLRFAGYAAYGMGVLGSTNVKRAVVAGQYHRQDGLYYGGEQLAASHKLLLATLRTVASPASSAIVIDVHTGLGPAGVDTLMPSLEATGDASAHANAAAIHQIFGRDVFDTAASPMLGTEFLIDAPTPGEATDSAAAGYDMTKGTTGRYPALIGQWQRALHVTQEFGTVPGPLVLRGMIIERAEWRFRKPAARASATTSDLAECPGSAFGANRAREIFYVRTASWQGKIVHRGVLVAEQALKALADAPNSVPAM